MTYLDPKNDLTFKCVFGEHKHLCMSLINSMLPLKKPIVSLEYQTGELIPELTCEAVGYMECAAYTIEQLEAYDQNKIDAMTERGLISAALEKGEAIGLEKGRLANKEETVINCHKEGIPFDMISTVTGLTIEQIAEILKRHGVTTRSNYSSTKVSCRTCTSPTSFMSSPSARAPGTGRY